MIGTGCIRCWTNWTASGGRRDFRFSFAMSRGIVRAMTRMLDIPAAPTAPFGARVVVNLRGLLLLTLR